ncbi:MULTISPECIES: alpha/beta hydrolase [unclassified Lactobacillus]|uniref:alpha/beta hydrolase n=1 Tax=unclassified Lactobacillus TaxID=2620435 RepID=UPI000EFC5400|nr:MULTISPECIES: alpha/beta hydrolase [unclassified Lactobacillus]RMC38707.1 alpha/beta hydrolase [Lactobacillus sp. ESL0237]RMC43052.1 alpha/beta hydrolase [Lactobacillus sp. ESL0234]RMC43906.1 alpha/beta hydrolase [Lactobacillus sp. ESL0236]RMC44913.1 alpha/beta hydrolase [Lactobacillus sp. ESL0230]
MTEPDYQKLVNKMRTEFKQGDDKRDAGLPTQIPEVERFDNLSYGVVPQFQSLDVYLPKKRTDQKLPVIVNIHGGGWVYGTKETYQFYCLALAKAGFAVVNANYRLAPDVVYPGELDDLNLVFHWIADSTNANNYQFDLNNVFIVGDSAGGQMAEQILAIYTNNEYRKYFGYALPNLTIKAAALNCGLYFLTETNLIVGAPEAYFRPEIRLTKHDQLNVERYLTQALPPIFLMTSNGDFLRNSAFTLSGYLSAKNIFHEMHFYGDTDHLRGHVFHINQKDDLARQCNLDELNFFRKYIN